jgi:hypothetical protein
VSDGSKPDGTEDSREVKVQAAADAIIVAIDGLSFEETLEAFENAIGGPLLHSVARDHYQLLKEIHAAVLQPSAVLASRGVQPIKVRNPDKPEQFLVVDRFMTKPARIQVEQLYAAARKVVEARYRPDSEWDDLKEAIGELGALLGITGGQG